MIWEVETKGYHTFKNMLLTYMLVFMTLSLLTNKYSVDAQNLNQNGSEIFYSFILFIKHLKFSQLHHPFKGCRYTTSKDCFKKNMSDKSLLEMKLNSKL